MITPEGIDKKERKEDISYFIQQDRIWPPTSHVYLPNNPFMKALHEVLERLPEDVFDEVLDKVYFVVDFEGLLGINAPIVVTCPPKSEPYNIKVSNIIIFNQALKLSHESLVGLLAHEIAHSFSEGLGYSGDEKFADHAAKEWGFATEIGAIRREISANGKVVDRELKKKGR